MKEKKGRGQTRKSKVEGFQVIEEECIWMKAGVVNFRTCDQVYDCNACPFDKGMRKAMGLSDPLSTKDEIPPWVAHLKKKYTGAIRPCRHSLTGRIDAPKICPMNYECHHCSFDQMLDDLQIAQPAEVPDYQSAAGYRMAKGYYYHMGHSWARFEYGGRVRVGFDDFIVKVLGAAQRLELPPLGAELKEGEVGWALGRDTHQAAVLAPVSGTVLAVNPKAQAHPEIPHQDPYQEGWLFVMEPNRPKKDMKRLYFGKASMDWMEQEGQTLRGLFGQEYEQSAATGGKPVDDVFGRFPDIGWDRLVTTFLKTEKINPTHP